MQVRKAVLRAAGAAMVACAIAPWIGAGSASAAGIAYVDNKWDGTNSATNQTVARASCEYNEITMTHAGTGWHFVMTGGTGLTDFTANFASAGPITVTTTETAAGVIVQGGKGAVVYTPTDDTLTSVAAAPFSGHPGWGDAAVDDTMQLSHLCSGVTETPTPSDSVSDTPSGRATSSVSDTPTVGQHSGPATTPVTTPVSTPPTTASQQVSVLPTKKSSTPGDLGPRHQGRVRAAAHRQQPPGHGARRDLARPARWWWRPGGGPGSGPVEQAPPALNPGPPAG